MARRKQKTLEELWFEAHAENILRSLNYPHPKQTNEEWLGEKLQELFELGFREGYQLALDNYVQLLYREVDYGKERHDPNFG